MSSRVMTSGALVLTAFTICSPIVPYEDVVEVPLELPQRPPETDYERPPARALPVRPGLHQVATSRLRAADATLAPGR